MCVYLPEDMKVTEHPNAIRAVERSGLPGVRGNPSEVETKEPPTD